MDPYAELGEFYNVFFQQNAEVTAMKNERIIAALTSRLNALDDLTVADIGGGTGLVTFGICQLVQRVSLVEPSASMLTFAKKAAQPDITSNVEFVRGSLTATTLPDHSVDIVLVINDPFQYLLMLDEQVTALNEIKRILKPGGLVFLDLMNFFSLILNYRVPRPLKLAFNDKTAIRIFHHAVDAERECWIHRDYIMIEDNKTGQLKKIESTHELKMVSQTEMYMLFERTGFVNIEIIIPRKNGASTNRIWCFARIE
jgi:ubiquinone/menaquinone biosynthesis C-methylase UbiE